MALRRFFVDQVRNGMAELVGEDAWHLAGVLRAETGQQFEISDNRHVYVAEIAEVSKDRVAFRIVESLPAAAPAVRITVFPALYKFDRFEWMVEKATELGVDAIVPVNSARSEKGLFEAAGKRVERWRKIARESSRQSRRAFLPEIRQPGRFTDVAGQISGFRLMLDEAPSAPPLLEVPRLPFPEEINLLIGPEGGWTAEERQTAVSRGWTAVSLGPRVLRAETAAVAAIAILSGVCEAAILRSKAQTV